MYGWRNDVYGLGDTPPNAPASNAAVAPPTLALLNVTKFADFTNGGIWSQGDQYRVQISGTGVNLPVSLNGSVIGSTDPSTGFFTYNGVINQPASFSETWSVPSGSYPNLGVLAGFNKTLNFQLAGSTAPPTGGTSSFNLPGGPIPWLIGGVILLGVLIAK